MYKKLLLIFIIFSAIIGCYGIDESAVADSNKKSSLSSACYVLKLGINTMGVGMRWFTKSNYNWSSSTNELVSKKIHPIVGMFCALIVFIVELIINILVFYVESILMIVAGIILSFFGAILVPIILVFLYLSGLFMPT